MRTLIFGVRGQLGRDLLKQFSVSGKVSGYDLPELDIADGAAVHAAVKESAPDVIINAAAYTDVEGAEDHIEAAFLANEAGARHAAEVAAYFNVPIVYISTDFVFDGTKNTPYLPEDPVSPLGVYARSKAAGEAATRKANPRHFIVRTAWLYGPGGNNFVEKMLRAAQTRPKLEVVEDETGSPTHTYDLAESIHALCETTAYGIYHAVNAGACSRYEFACEILRLAGLDTPISPCAAVAFPSKAARPAYSVLDTGALERAAGYVPRPWKAALTHYMQRREELK